MKIRQIQIANILGIEALTIEPGNLCVVSGRNGAGKSSVLAAIRCVLSGGHDPDLIRQGAEEGAVTITLADGVTLTKTIRPDKSTLVVRHPELGKISKSQAWIDRICDSLSLDPIAFLTADPKERVNIFLEALPIKLRAEQLAFLPLAILKGKDLDRHAMEVLDELEHDIRESRRDLNATAKEKRATINQLAETLAPVVASTPATPISPTASVYVPFKERLDQWSQELKDLNAETRKRIETAKTLAREAEMGARTAAEKWAGEVTADTERQITTLRAIAATRIAQLVEERERNIRSANAVRDMELVQIQEEYEPKAKLLNEQIGNARAGAERQAADAKTREHIATLSVLAKTLEEKSAGMTLRLETLGGLRSDLLATLPIPGASISDGELLINGIKFDRLNMAERMRIAIEIAKLKAGDLGLILVDELESFDSFTWCQFEAAALESGLQFVAAKVSDDQELKVEIR